MKEFMEAIPIFLITINRNYAALLSLISSIVMIVVTIIYVGQTRRQANSAEKSVELVAKQLRLDKQPCIIPEITDSRGSAYDVSTYTRIQLSFKIKLRNVGDAPAINIFTMARIAPQHIAEHTERDIRMEAADNPYFVQAIRKDQDKDVEVLFETDEILKLIEDLSINMKLNWERIEKTPAENYIRGPKLVITILYKNLMGQWYESTLLTQLGWLEYKNPPKRKTHNVNENTIPPKRIKSGDQFKACMISSRYSPLSVKMRTQEYVNSVLEKYAYEDPDIAGNRGMMLNQ